MNKQLYIGLKNQTEQIVQYDDTAVKYRSGAVEVFATPAMIALMEKTASESVVKYLPHGYNTVGINVNINHIKATPAGQKVICESELVDINNKKLTFKLTAYDEKGKIGYGIHERIIINVEKFLSKL